MGRGQGMCVLLGLFRGPQQNVEKSLLPGMDETLESQGVPEENEATVSVQADEWFWQSEVWRDHSLVLACGVLAGLEAQRERTPPTPWAGGSVFGDGIHGHKERSFS